MFMIAKKIAIIHSTKALTAGGAEGGLDSSFLVESNGPVMVCCEDEVDMVNESLDLVVSRLC